MNPDSVSSALEAVVRERIAESGGWWPFDRFMQAALYEPGLGYYSGHRPVFGVSPRSGSDFVTAPQMSAVFGQALAVQVRQAMREGAARELWEFGAGTGVLAADLLKSLRELDIRYTIVDVSGGLRERQRERLAPFGDRVRWLDAWPESIAGVVIGNEVLDAMPVKLLVRHAMGWRERGVSVDAASKRLVFVDRPTALEPPLAASLPVGTVTEVHQQAFAFVSSLVQRMQARSMALFIDYGFPEAEYYHPQRMGGTLMCHRAHRADDDPLSDVGDKDITTHVNFTGVALAAQDAGAQVMGYTSQGRFLINCGLVSMLEGLSLAQRSAAHRLLAEHEMGELFKVIALGRGLDMEPVGFSEGDRMHRL